MRISNLKNGVTFLFLVLTVNWGYSQTDTIVIEKEPIVIKKEVYYKSNYNPSIARNVLYLEFNAFNNDAFEAQDEEYNQVNFSTESRLKDFHLGYARQINGFSFGLGAALSSSKTNINQVSYSQPRIDSSLQNRIDTVSCFVSITPDRGVEHICITDTSTYWQRDTTYVSKESNNSYRITQVRIPLSLSYRVYKSKWSFGIGVELASTFRISNSSEIIFFNRQHERQNVVQDITTSFSLDVTPKFEIGYNLPIGIGVYTNLAYRYFAVGPYKKYNIPSNMALGLGLKYFF